MELDWPTTVFHPPSLEWHPHSRAPYPTLKVTLPLTYIWLPVYSMWCSGDIQGKEGRIKGLAGHSQYTNFRWFSVTRISAPKSLKIVAKTNILLQQQISQLAINSTTTKAREKMRRILRIFETFLIHV
jgi:hypothetical protein